MCTHLCSAEVLGLGVVEARPHRKFAQAGGAVNRRRLDRGGGALDHRHLC